jgi:hypothetical protein
MAALNSVGEFGGANKSTRTRGLAGMGQSVICGQPPMRGELSAGRGWAADTATVARIVTVKKSTFDGNKTVPLRRYSRSSRGRHQQNSNGEQHLSRFLRRNPEIKKTSDGSEKLESGTKLARCLGRVRVVVVCQTVGRVIAESVKKQDARRGIERITPLQRDQRVDNREENTVVRSPTM